MTEPTAESIQSWELQARKIRDTSTAFRQCLRALREVIDSGRIVTRRAEEAERWQRFVADGLGYSEHEGGVWRCAMAAEVVNGIRAEREASAVELYQSPDDGQSIMFRRPQHAAQPVVEGGHLSGFAHVAIFSVDVPSVGVWEEGL
jgi:hypothetical protein